MVMIFYLCNTVSIHIKLVYYQVLDVNSIYFLFVSHFLRSIEVGHAGKYCLGSEYSGGQDDLQTQRRFEDSMKGAQGI